MPVFVWFNTKLMQENKIIMVMNFCADWGEGAGDDFIWEHIEVFLAVFMSGLWQ